MIHGHESFFLYEFTAIAIKVSLVLAALIYIRGWLLVRSIFPTHFQIYRLVAFMTGILSVAIAIGSPVESRVHVLLTFHMVQHLLLMAVAPPLILLGAPALPLLRGLPQMIAHYLISFLSWGVVKRIRGIIVHPIFCWLGASLALILWHIPPIFELAMRWQWLHTLERISFFGTGLLFWLPVIQPWPSKVKWSDWYIPLYLFCATLPCDALSAFLVFCDRVVYNSYLHAPRVWSLSPFQDQDLAGALMWVTETIVLLVPSVFVTQKLLSPRRSHQVSNGDLSSRHTDDTSTVFFDTLLQPRP
jgi:cytochrome c oxidase assembly factor CtaG